MLHRKLFGYTRGAISCQQGTAQRRSVHEGTGPLCSRKVYCVSVNNLALVLNFAFTKAKLEVLLDKISYCNFYIYDLMTLLQ